jgi:hypothetical protein
VSSAFRPFGEDIEADRPESLPGRKPGDREFGPLVRAIYTTQRPEGTCHVLSRDPVGPDVGTVPIPVICQSPGVDQVFSILPELMRKIGDERSRNARKNLVRLPRNRFHLSNHSTSAVGKPRRIAPISGSVFLRFFESPHLVYLQQGRARRAGAD